MIVHISFKREKSKIRSILRYIERFSQATLHSFFKHGKYATTTTTKSLQSCPALCDPIDGSPPGSTVPGILRARTLEWVAISFSNAWKWKVKVKSLDRVWLFATPWTAAYQALLSMGFSRQEYRSGLPLPSLAPHPTLCLMLSCGSLEILVISEHGPCIFILQRAPQIMQLLLPVSQILLWRPS